MRSAGKSYQRSADKPEISRAISLERLRPVALRPALSHGLPFAEVALISALPSSFSLSFFLHNLLRNGEQSITARVNWYLE